ncbi:bifunctional glutamate N-acetyltransferase/amino-acid acetyltransferase ArgJ [soil metagenome]
MSITLPLGFVAAATTAGLKPSGRPDLALLVRRERGLHAGFAAAFTTNQLVGAPVLLGRAARARALRGEMSASALLINAGNSNAATGPEGVAAAERCCAGAALALGVDPLEVVPCSTGIIGRPLQDDRIIAALPALVGRLARGTPADEEAAAAIMTTDRVPKTAQRSLRIGGAEIRIGAMAKGAGMIAPRLDSASGPARPAATMLAFITTDAAVESPVLQAALDAATSDSFNIISVDNHASCSDTVIAVSSGLAGRSIIPGTRDFDAFAAALHAVCLDLADQIVADGEGATRTFAVAVRGAATPEAARLMAREIVNSSLVKCAVHGGDPNWGRIITAAGNAGVAFDVAKASLTIGGVPVFEQGRPMTAAQSDPRLKSAMSAPRVEMILTVGPGSGAARMVGCDLTAEYIRINADYTT